MNEVDELANGSLQFGRLDHVPCENEGGSAGDDNGVTIKAENSSPEETENGDLELADLSLRKKRQLLLHHKREEVQCQHSQQQGAFAWAGILSQRHLKVLLVEDDDSTRHVVAALLRNCGYEVMSARNGRHAWEVVSDPDVRVDLVLTDVMMPALSGIELLTRIMSCESTKQIPVVMMSCVDSMDMVFKCLSKGAVDFLVKPVRKNELKNLWQHFWRKCLSSSGSGSGDKVNENNSGSYEGSENGSSGLNAGGGSDNGSGTQSSWTKKPVEVRTHEDAPELALPGRETNQPPDTGASRTRVADERGLETQADQAIDLLGNIQDQRDAEKHNGTALENNAIAEFNSLPTLELSLKRPRPKESEEAESETRRVLHHSGGSAFSRYSSSGAALAQQQQQQQPATNTFPVSLWVGLGPGGVCVTAPGNRAGAGEESADGAAAAAEGVEGDKSEPGKPGVIPRPPNFLSYDRIAAAYGESLHHFFYPSAMQWASLTPPAGEERSTLPPPAQNEHHHHHHHHHHHGHQKAEAAANRGQRDGSQRNHHCTSSSVTGFNAADAGAGGQSGGSSYGVNASVNGSVSGSNNLSNNNGSGTGLATGNGESGKIGANANTNNNHSINGSSRGVNNNTAGSDSGTLTCAENTRLTRREMALNKFRQKRKERCFEKKVRYQSRKKLAEQRPRVRGQFVKQGAAAVHCEDELDEEQPDQSPVRA